MGRGEFGRRSPREGERGWERDEQGRLFRHEAGSRVFRDIADRDAAVEEIYTSRPCERACCPSILASVAGHQRELIEQYMAWAARRVVSEVHDSETLAQWERERFGARLYVAAHGVLLYAVRVARYGDRPRQRKEPRVIPGLTNAEHLERMQVALSKNLEEAHTMPERGMA